MFLPWDITVSSGADFEKNVEKAAWLAGQIDAYSNEEISDNDLDESLAEIGIDTYEFDQEIETYYKDLGNIFLMALLDEKLEKYEVSD